ncbi:uncharacterized protein LOC110440615 [Mizuhopecten yessoensis]|uniref:Uncharacterized protein n=1 Tax=Mizuhopecten yessoensis TaxID=6573 RepID=A0A210PKT5_MIZYE|nr:uncharacterized protein LOC110440615 [Mizuhopecten yessoensis]XP_021339445.1 uncharacterized protein LOC110440615 [Mizuhopecten yessoensis]XP_021339446.1 uncharacterized protein LOC110440615 [Mizuhopecten yessoensis]OWF37101.1 hypothetical protein KP79_PYT09792 [Mizuhopecten yessoensis]
MTHTDETMGILEPQYTKWRHWKMYFILGVLVAMVTFLVVLLGITAGLNLDDISDTSNYNKNNVIQLKDILPNSFFIMFNIEIENSSDFEVRDKITVKWETESSMIRYQQEIEVLMLNQSVVTTVSILDERAVVSYSLENQKSWKCAEDIKLFDWFSILQLLMISVEANYSENNCPGRIWTIPYKGKRVSICINGFRIVYVRYGNQVAISKDWKVPSPSSIVLHMEAPTCTVKYSGVHTFKHEQIATDSTRNQSINGNNFENDVVVSRNDKPICLFIHGLGNQNPKTGFKTLTRMDYWGHIENNTPQCAAHRFIQFNTVDNGWDSTELHQMFCEFATGLKFGGNISNKILFSHSMGNNIVAAALHSKICTLDKTSSKWFSVSAPWRGCMVADRLQKFCSSQLKDKDGNVSPHIISRIFRHTKFCSDNGNTSAGYTTLGTAYKSKTGISNTDLVAVARRLVDGALCGTSPWGIGLNLRYSGTMKFIQVFSKMKTPNDGIVALNSCSIFGEKFKNSYKSKFYKMSVNHVESSTKFGCSKDLCSWYRYL